MQHLRGCTDKLMELLHGFLGDFPFLPYKRELPLGNATPHSIEAHITGLGPMKLNSVVCDSSSSGIVGGDGCSVLGMAHFGEGASERIGFLGVVEEGSGFCLDR
jgi:hypothetical protein